MNATELYASFDHTMHLSLPFLRQDLSPWGIRSEDPALVRQLAKGQVAKRRGYVPVGRYHAGINVDSRSLHDLYLPPFFQKEGALVMGKGLVKSEKKLGLDEYRKDEVSTQTGSSFQGSFCLLQNEQSLLPWKGACVVKGSRSLAKAMEGNVWHPLMKDDGSLLIVVVKRRTPRWDDKRPWLTGNFPIWHKTLVILASEYALETESWRKSVQGILSTFTNKPDWQTLAQVIRGEREPEARLPYSMPLDVDRHWTLKGKKLRLKDPDGTMSLPFVYGYRTNTTYPFCFGHGLSYTSFRYSDLVISNGHVSFRVTNTGSRKGTTVAQLYVQEDQSSVWQPRRELKAFEKVCLDVGESKTVSVPIKKDWYTYWQGSEGLYREDGGLYSLLVGTSSRDIVLSGQLPAPRA